LFGQKELAGIPDTKFWHQDIFALEPECLANLTCGITLLKQCAGDELTDEIYYANVDPTAIELH